MTQHQLINQLQDIMPEIVETKNPRAVMLKCAKKNNLSIAQLEKLGHVFNTCKTLIGLEKQATRGASFNIVDVPSMVAEYASYTPGTPSTKQQKDVHSQINEWMRETDKSANAAALEWAECFTPMGKAASAKKLPSVNAMLDEYFKLEGGFDFKNLEEGNQWHEEDLDYVNKPDILHKAASLTQESDSRRSDRLYKEACEAHEQVLLEATETAKSICADITNRIRQDDLDWQDVAYDLHDQFHEKAARAVDTLEDYFRIANLRVPHVALEKRGYTRAIPANKFCMYEQVGNLLSAMEIHDQTSEDLLNLRLEKAADKKKDKGTSFGVTAANGILRTGKAVSDTLNSLPDWKTAPDIAKNMVNSVPWFEDAINEEKIRNTARTQMAQQGALQQVILSDPVIQQADQAEVEDLYNTISSLAPTVAKDPVSVAPVLKEALQYGSLPIQQVKDLISAEKDFQNMRKYRAEANNLEGVVL